MATGRQRGPSGREVLRISAAAGNYEYTTSKLSVSPGSSQCLGGWVEWYRYFGRPAYHHTDNPLLRLRCDRHCVGPRCRPALGPTQCSERRLALAVSWFRDVGDEGRCGVTVAVDVLAEIGRRIRPGMAAGSRPYIWIIIDDSGGGKILYWNLQDIWYSGLCSPLPPTSGWSPCHRRPNELKLQLEWLAVAAEPQGEAESTQQVRQVGLASVDSLQPTSSELGMLEVVRDEAGALLAVRDLIAAEQARAADAERCGTRESVFLLDFSTPAWPHSCVSWHCTNESRAVQSGSRGRCHDRT
eukprot:SAG22_NODE_55_length_23749_cov_24.622918_2_plen_299_part_00